MNYLVMSMLTLTLLPILFGLLLGLLRGSRRALLRLILVVICIALAFAFTGVVSGKVMSVEIEAGKNVSDIVSDTLIEMLPESAGEAMSEYLTSLVQAFLQVFIFLILFFFMWLLSWMIVYPICKIFVKKGAKKRRLIGMGIGAAQGIIVALVVGIVFTGLIVQVNNVMVAAEDLSTALSQADSGNNGDEYEAQYLAANGDENVGRDDDNNYAQNGDESEFSAYTSMISDYVNSPLGKMYNGVGAKPFDWITTVKLENGKKVTLSSQINVITDLSKMAKELVELQNFDFAGLLDDVSDINDLTALFDRLGATIDGFSDTTKDLINDVVASLADEFGLDLGDIKFTEIKFHEEGQIFANLLEYADKETFEQEDVDGIIENLAKSDLILGLLQQQNFDINSQLNQEQLDAVSDKIDEMAADQTLSQSKIDALRKIFGLND